MRSKKLAGSRRRFFRAGNDGGLLLRCKQMRKNEIAAIIQFYFHIYFLGCVCNGKQWNSACFLMAANSYSMAVLNITSAFS